MMLGEGTSTEGMVESIQQNGNFFIMDSDQVVSNPYHELQNEAMNKDKSTSLTERLTAVRNNVCEHTLKSKTQQLERQRTHTLRNLHVDTSNLRYQVKVMDINKRRNDLSLKKRLLPKKDFSFDTRQIENSAKRIGVTSESSFYLDRRLSYPLRINISKDHDSKPFIKKARKTMEQHKIKKKQEESDLERLTARTERAPTALTVSTSVDFPSPEPSMKGPARHMMRRGSKSAPPPQKISSAEPQRANSRLSNIDETDARLPSITNSRNRDVKSHVTFKDPGTIRSIPNGLHRSKTYHPCMNRQTRSYSDRWDSDSDDDYSLCEKIDLRALLFGDKVDSGESKSAMSGTVTPRTSVTQMSSEVPLMLRGQQKPQITEEQVLKEKKEIKEKINKFLGNIKKEEKVVVKEEKKVDQATLQAEEAKKELVSRAAILLSVFSKPLDKTKIWGYQSPENDEAAEKEDKMANLERETSAQEDEEEDVKELPKKNLWKFIKTKVQNGAINKKYTSNDLLLEQLTGILVQADKKPKIPTHSASRALRHTPTFKMRRVIEDLAKQQTRYEQQEVERLKKAEQDALKPFRPMTNEEEEENSGVQQVPAPTQAWTAQTNQTAQKA